ncbi:MAG TPA: hypothetical protein VMT16_08470 [Thermoanaerobaculia bacterium]|nr:hypothetical protein [Thermoanaerobaculia bacterium]
MTLTGVMPRLLVALQLPLLLPGVVDLHALLPGQAHAAVEVAAAFDEILVEPCQHGTARHVEAAVHERRVPCPLCRHHVPQVVRFGALAAGRPFAVAAPPAVPLGETAPCPPAGLPGCRAPPSC